MPAVITALVIPPDRRPAGFAAKRLHLHAHAPPYIGINNTVSDLGRFVINLSKTAGLVSKFA
jgi:hypothetical protein